MALAVTNYAWETPGVPVADAAITTTSRTYNSGELVVVEYATDNDPTVGTEVITFSNSGTAQTWTKTADVNPVGNGVGCRLAVAYCVMSVTQAMTISVSTNLASSNLVPWARVAVYTGFDTSTPIPAGNRFSGSATTDVSQSITPSSTGSMLRLVCADWSETNSFAAGASCTTIATSDVPTKATVGSFRPTTDPRSDASAFTISETDTAGTISWAAYEVKAAAASGTNTPLMGASIWMTA